MTNTLLAAGCFQLARRLVRQPGGPFTILGTCVLFSSVTILGMEALGNAGAIVPFGILALAVGVFALGMVARLPLSRTADRALAGPAAAPKEVSRPSWDAQVCLGLLWMAAIFLGIRSLLLGVKVISDGPIYHLYFAVRWWKAGKLFPVAAPFGENAATYFPANGELWFTWLLTSWGSERLAKIGQAPFLLMAMVAVWACTRTLRIDRSASLVAICCFASSTPLFLFSFESNVDTIFAASYLTAAAFFLRTMRGEGGMGDLTLGALAAGAALGTKTVGVVFLPPLMAMTALGLLTRPRPFAIRLREVAVLCVIPMFTCGYWYFQNALLTGNPLYPLNLVVGGRTILSGCYGPDAMRESPYFLPIENWRALIDILFTVTDPRVAPFWVAAVAVGWWTQCRGVPHGRGYLLTFSALAVVNIALYWVFIPYRTQQRFMLHALGLAAVPLAQLLSRSVWARDGGLGCRRAPSLDTPALAVRGQE